MAYAQTRIWWVAKNSLELLYSNESLNPDQNIKSNINKKNLIVNRYILLFKLTTVKIKESER